VKMLSARADERADTVQAHIQASAARLVEGGLDGARACARKNNKGTYSVSLHIVKSNKVMTLHL